jgi:translation initiation factor 1
MSEICNKCGLPKPLCVCETIAKDEQQIRIRTVKRRFGKLTTLIEGFGEGIDLKKLVKELKSKFACGGTVKNKTIELQGNHIKKVKEELIKLGFNPSTIVSK